MKKVFLFFLFVSCFSLLASAENEKNNGKVSANLPGYRTSFEANPFWHNWFISGNLGANTFIAENWKDAQKFSVTFMPTLAVGKWFNPWLGVRLQGGGGSLHGFDGTNTVHMHYMNAHFDVMLGLFNFFGKYREDRKFDLIPYFGLGGMTRKHDQSFTLNGGVQARYAINERFDVNVEMNGLIADDDMVAKGGFPNDGIAGLTAGVTYRFKNRGFRTAASHAEMARLNNENEALRGQVSELSKRPVKPQVIEKIIEKEIPAAVDYSNTLLYVIPFKLARHEIEEIHKPILFNVKEFMAQHPDVKIVVRGCADKVGSKSVNEKLSKERAYTVAEYLQKEYGISEDRMIIKYTGNENPFFKEEDTWNRCVIIMVAK